jgi:hypothetical protein
VDFAWSLVESGGHNSEVFAAMDTRVCSSRKVLAQQAIGVLDRAPLPGACGVTEVHRDECLAREILVAGHGRPFQYPDPTPGIGVDGLGVVACFRQAITQVLSSAIPCQVHEDDEASGPLDQCGDGEPATFSDD